MNQPTRKAIAHYHYPYLLPMAYQEDLDGLVVPFPHQSKILLFNGAVKCIDGICIHNTLAATNFLGIVT